MHEAARYASKIPVCHGPIEQISRRAASQCSRRVVAEEVEDEPQVRTGIGIHGLGVSLFAELLMRPICKNGNVRISRSAQSEQPEQQQLTRCIVEQIGAANDLSDLLCRVVDNNRELIGNDAIAPRDDEIANLPVEAL